MGDLAEHLLASGRWLEERVDKLVADLLACGPSQSSRRHRRDLDCGQISQPVALQPRFGFVDGRRTAGCAAGHARGVRRCLVLLLLVAGCGASSKRAAGARRPEPTAAPPAAPCRSWPRRTRDGAGRDVLDAARPARPLAARRRDARPEGRGRAASATRPCSCFLSGGPGEPGVPFLERARKWLGPAADQVRIVAHRPARHRRRRARLPGAAEARWAPRTSRRRPRDAVHGLRGDARRPSASSSPPPTPSPTSRRCGSRSAPTSSPLDGISYGTYVAQRYALAHPSASAALVLDSRRARRGRRACSRRSRSRPPRRVLGARDDARRWRRSSASSTTGPQLLDMLTGAVGRRAARRRLPSTRSQQAASGDDASLDGAGSTGVARRRARLDGGAAQPGPAREHAVRGLARAVGRRVGAARGPQGRRSTPPPRKLADDDLYPYDRATATGNGFALQCLYWPPVDVPTPPGPRELPGRARRCCSTATATSRRRWSGRSRRPSARPAAS